MGKINCNPIREEILNEIKEELKSIKTKLTLAIVQVGHDPASNTYVANKMSTCYNVGINTELHRISSKNSIDVIRKIQSLNNDNNIHGIILQLPLPDELKGKERMLLDCISPFKDVDGLTSNNIARLWTGRRGLKPATAEAVCKLLPEDLSGKTVTIINRSDLIGKPLIKMLLDRNATVTIRHSKSKNKSLDTDYVITGIGKPGIIDVEYNHTFVGTFIDCGISKDEHGKICGDINLKGMGKSRNYTPVPGGVGILTTACIASNILEAYKLQLEHEYQFDND